jgi:hypothetical protein
MSDTNGSAPSNATRLREAWALRSTIAESLIQAELQFKRMVQEASVDDLVGLLEGFSPGRSLGPAWTNTFEGLAERLWYWCAPEVMDELEARFRAKGMPWMAAANCLSAEHREALKARIHQHPTSRLPAFTMG